MTKERHSPLAKAFVEISGNVLFRDLDGEGVLLNLQTGEYYGLNRVGTEVWRSLLASESVAAIHSHLLEEYEVSPETLWRDLEELVAEMDAKGLVAVRVASDG